MITVPDCWYCEENPAAVQIHCEWADFNVCADHEEDVTQILLESDVNILEFEDREDWIPLWTQQQVSPNGWGK